MPPLEYPPAAMVVAELADGPLKGRSVEAAIVEGRPRKTIDLPAGDGTTCRWLRESTWPNRTRAGDPSASELAGWREGRLPRTAPV
jgi:hypothetical protein